MSSHIVPTRTYFGIFGVLMILLAATVGAARVDLGAWNIVLAMTIAIVKAVLVVLYFMHVRYSSRLTAVFIGAGIFWFILLIGLTFSDYMSRDWMPVLGK